MEIEGQKRVVEYAPDPDLKDSEQAPLLEEGGIEGFLRREVLPYAPDAWYDPGSVKVGYEISFTRYFYQPQPLRAPDEIWADIRSLEQESERVVGGDFQHRRSQPMKATEVNLLMFLKQSPQFTIPSTSAPTPDRSGVPTALG